MPAVCHMPMGIRVTILKAVCTESAAAAATGEGETVLKVEKNGLASWATKVEYFLNDVPSHAVHFELLFRH